MRNYPFNCVYEAGHTGSHSTDSSRVDPFYLCPQGRLRSTCPSGDNLILLVAQATSVFHLSDQDWSYSTYPAPCTDRVIRKEISLDWSFFSFPFFFFYFHFNTLFLFKQVSNHDCGKVFVQLICFKVKVVKEFWFLIGISIYDLF